MQSLISRLALVICKTSSLVCSLVCHIFFWLGETIEINTFLSSLLLHCSSLLPKLQSNLVLCLTSMTILHNDTHILVAPLIFAQVKFLSFAACLGVTCEESEVVENNRARNRHVEWSCLVSVLRNVHKVVANCNLVAIKATSFVSEHKKGVATEWVLLNRSWLW